MHSASRRRLTRLIACVALLLAAPAAPRPASAAAADPVTVIFVRHAEKEAEPREDPPLSAAGRARAEALARALAPAGVTAVITTQFARTRQTAELLAGPLGLTPAVVAVTMDPADPRRIDRRYYERMADEILERRGETVLVVGHSNTIPEMIAALGGKAAPIDERTYDDLFVVTVVDRGNLRITHLKLGAGA